MAADRNCDPKTPALKACGRDLNELAKQNRLDPIIGRRNEIERVITLDLALMVRIGTKRLSTESGHEIWPRRPRCPSVSRPIGPEPHDETDDDHPTLPSAPVARDLARPRVTACPFSFSASHPTC